MATVARARAAWPTRELPTVKSFLSQDLRDPLCRVRLGEGEFGMLMNVVGEFDECGALLVDRRMNLVLHGDCW
jgi:hypothetical protein